MSITLQPASEPATRLSRQIDARPAAARGLRVEIPTLIVALVIFGGYGALTWFFHDVPLWIGAPLTALWLTWYSSLQHETIHNHPTASRHVNSALGSLPLALWIPYRIYRVTHRQHHRQRGRHLTEPVADPESFFMKPGFLAAHGWVWRSVHRVNGTLAGRLLIGPALSLSRFWSSEAGALMAGDRYRRAVWLRHVVAGTLVLLWVTQVCHIPFLVYWSCVVYPSVALTHLRSFSEHRADPDCSKRTMTVEGGRLWSLLFLNNNLHIAHHLKPEIPWYQLPDAWHRLRTEALGRGLVFEHGYRQVASRYLLRPVIEVEHPGIAQAPAPLP